MDRAQAEKMRNADVMAAYQMTETKTDVVLLIERVRRNMPLNRDVLAICELLERALVVSTRRDVVSTLGDVVSTREPAVVSTQCQCAPCIVRRAAKAATMRRLRAKQKPKRINPLDGA